MIKNTSRSVCGMQFKQCLEGNLQTHMHIQKGRLKSITKTVFQKTGNKTSKKAKGRKQQ